MPELPEVETVRRGLLPYLEGARIKDVDVRVPKLRMPIPDDFSKRLTGNLIERLERRSKYILMHCEDGTVIILHLGMSGKVTIYPENEAAPKPEKHDHVILRTQAGADIIYNDPRRFGILTLSDEVHLSAHPLLKNIGPEPLGNSFYDAYLYEGLKKRRSSIKTMLLNQTLVAGLGNIYVCEALWRAGIDPRRLAKDITEGEASNLVPIIRTVLSDAIEAGGSSLKDYRQANGELGYFQHSFKAYGRESEACLKADCDGTIDRIVQSNRSSFFCPTCQK